MKFTLYENDAEALHFALPYLKERISLKRDLDETDALQMSGERFLIGTLADDGRLHAVGILSLREGSKAYFYLGASTYPGSGAIRELVGGLGCAAIDRGFYNCLVTIPSAPSAQSNVFERLGFIISREENHGSAISLSGRLQRERLEALSAFNTTRNPVVPVDSFASTTLTPKSIALMLPPECQLQCKFCYTAGMYLEPSEPLSLYSNVLRSLKGFGPLPVYIGGLGETFFAGNMRRTLELVSRFQEFDFVLFSNLIELEKIRRFVEFFPNVRLMSRILSKEGGLPSIEGAERPSIRDVINLIPANRIAFEILLIPANLDKLEGLLETKAFLNDLGISVDFSASAPLGNAIETRQFLSEPEALALASCNNLKIFGSRDCPLIRDALVLSGSAVPLCPAALIKTKVGSIPDKFGKDHLSENDFGELRGKINELMERKRTIAARLETGASKMCIGREIAYRKMRV